MSEGSCNCEVVLNTLLAERNARLAFSLFGPFRAFVEVTKVDRRKRGTLPMLAATFCPFCGAKYPSAGK